MDSSRAEEAAVPVAAGAEPEAPPSPAPAGEAEPRRLGPRVALTRPAPRPARVVPAAPAIPGAVPAALPDLGIRHGRHLRERAIEILLFVNGMAAIVIIGLIFVFLFREGVAAFRDLDSRQFIGGTEIKSTYDPASDTFTEAREFATVWQPVSDEPKYSLIPLMNGSLLVALPATLISTLLGVLVGIYLAEIASHRVREIVKPAIELLAGIPTVIIGFIMLTVVATFVQQITHSHFRLNAFVGALGVSLVIIPVIASLTEDALRAVPEPLRLASYGLGATRWQTVSRVVVPAAVSGITAAALLGFGRALGETMIVLMATGNAALVTGNILSSVRTMTATIAAELGAVARDSEQYHALFFVGAVLFTMTFLFNLIAEVIVSRMRRRLRM
jgi:phosphate transport system permease protein